MATSEPPPFQESNRCDVCKCSFNTFRRRHHCRCCGRTLCYEHSSDQMTLPQYGIHSNVRVCSECFNNSARFKNDDSVPSKQSDDLVSETISRLDINEGYENKVETVPEQPVPANAACKCGMPLCICVAAPPPRPVPMQTTAASSSIQSNPRPKKDVTPKNRRSKEDSRLSQPSSGMHKSHVDYEVDGEGLREAIKNSDIVSVQELLAQGVDSNYCDKQGLSLLHLAAVFNQTEIAFSLMEHGARLDSKNLQGETPLDCAPATLQYKMRTKMEELSRQ